MIASRLGKESSTLSITEPGADAVTRECDRTGRKGLDFIVD